MKSAHYRSVLTCFGGLLLVTAGASQVNGQGIRIWADTVSNTQTHDNSVFKPFDDSHDEMYFMLAGASTHQGPISIPRISPANDDHWDMPPGGSISHVLLYEGFLGSGQAGVFTYALRDADSDLFETLLDAVRVAGSALAAIFIDPGIGLSQLGPALTSFVNSLSSDNDNTMGVWAMKVSNTNGVLTTTASNVQSVNVFSSSGNVLELSANGAGSNYYLRLHVELFHGSKLVNRTSGLCLDVPNLSLTDGVQVQQYTCNGGLNQRWLRVHDTGTNPIAGPVTIVSENSGSCLDVRGASTMDGAAIQQYHCHFGPDQQWQQTLLPILPISFGFRSVNSNKCIDNPGFSTASGTKIQQYDCNGGLNQYWIVQ
jgi:hypothetical protein